MLGKERKGGGGGGGGGGLITSGEKACSLGEGDPR